MRRNSLDFWSRRDPNLVLNTEGELSLSRAEFASRTRRIANFLGGLVEPRTRVSIMGRDSFDVLAVYRAVSHCGGVPVPVSYGLAPPERPFIIDDAGAQVVLDGAMEGWAPYLRSVRSPTR
jgi:acyl-CoA synthetase (AMP-forming)/AMP-acid ligase II